MKSLAQKYNQVEKLNDPTAHAEMIAITSAANSLSNWRLNECMIFVTKEPCPMCAGACLVARINRVVFGAEDPKAGSLGSLYQLGGDPRLNHEFAVTPRILQQECADLLTGFFADKRD